MGAIVSSNGQVSLPQYVRKALAIEPGDLIEIEVQGNEFVGRKLNADDSGIQWDQVYGSIDFDGRTTDDVMRDIRPTRSLVDERMSRALEFSELRNYVVKNLSGTYTDVTKRNLQKMWERD